MSCLCPLTDTLAHLFQGHTNLLLHPARLVFRGFSPALMAACIASASPTPRRALVSKYPTAPVSVKGGGEERKKGRGGKRERERKVAQSSVSLNLHNHPEEYSPICLAICWASDSPTIGLLSLSLSLSWTLPSRRSPFIPTRTRGTSGQ